MVEQQTFNLLVVGSTPASLTKQPAEGNSGAMPGVRTGADRPPAIPQSVFSNFKGTS